MEKYLTGEHKEDRGRCPDIWGIQWQDKRKQVQTENEKIPCKLKKKTF